MTEKVSQRRAALAARRDISPDIRAGYSAAICRRLEALDAVTRAKTIFSYLADGDEPDLAAFHSRARAAGKTLAFPVSAAGGAMEAYAPAEDDALAPGRFGIPAPAAENSRLVPPEDIDLVLVPCAAFDRAGGRLGRGGGYYDRYLARCSRAVTVAVAFECQGVSRVVREDHDAAMDMVVTEKDVYFCG